MADAKEPFYTAPLISMLDKSNKCPKCGYYTPKSEPTEAQIEAAAIAVHIVLERMMAERRMINVGNIPSEPLTPVDIAKAALIAASEVSS